jgi:hypothetical protein
VTALPRPINKHGDVKGRHLAHHAASRRDVFIRCRGRCEAEDCTEAATDWAHLFGRRHLLSEPWTSSPACTMGLCRGHHNAVDRGLDPDLLHRLRMVGLVRLCTVEGAPLSLISDDPLGSIRAVEQWLVQRENGRDG